jgi:hypothetical protein
MRSGSQMSLLHPVSKATLFIMYIGWLTSTTGQVAQNPSETDNYKLLLRENTYTRTYLSQEHKNWGGF